MWKLMPANVSEFAPGPRWFEDESGNKSEKFKDAHKYSDGFAVVKVGYNNYKFRDEKGNLSESFYFANSYKNGFAEVAIRPRQDSNYNLPTPKAFRDKQGNISEEFYIYCSYSKGVAVVKKLDEDGFRFRYEDGTLSHQYHNIKRVFSPSDIDLPDTYKVKSRRRDHITYFEDGYGNEMPEMPKYPYKFNSYLSKTNFDENASVYSLDTDCFGIDWCLQAIMKKEQAMLEYAYSLCVTDDDYASLINMAEDVYDYVKDMAVLANSQKNVNAGANKRLAKETIINGF